jgi:sugar-phosphatase
MIDAVLFDMDGVIIDSEPLWGEAQNEIFTSLGVDYNKELATRTIGIGTYDTVDFWYQQQPWKGISHEEVGKRIHEQMLLLIRQKGKMMQGLMHVLDYFKSKNLKIALASGAPMSIINLVVDQLEIRDYFGIIHSIDFEEYGKPHPAIFLTVAQKFGVEPLKCLVIEDSFNGLIAAKAARMKAIAYLPNSDFNNTRFDFADLKLRSFGEFNDTYFNYLQNLI